MIKRDVFRGFAAIAVFGKSIEPLDQTAAIGEARAEDIPRRFLSFKTPIIR
jgi:hypothetical protein